jgi:hypothetical protein
MKNCRGANWEYALMLAQYNPRNENMSGKDYYSQEVSDQRESYCKKQCKGDFDCNFYCTNMGIDDTSTRIDIASGAKPNKVYYKDNCFQYSCYEWDYKCLLRCEGSNWEYAPFSLVQMKTEQVSLASSSFNKYAIANTDYYSQENNKARYDLCKSMCSNDFDCKWYCGQARWKDNDIRLDIKMGNK